jgi:hypothetical protein
MSCVEYVRFDAFLGWSMVEWFKIVSVQVVLPTGHTDQTVEKIHKYFDEDRQSTILVIAARLGVSCGTQLLILREDVNIGGSPPSLCLGLPCWPDLVACDLFFICDNAIGATRASFPECPWSSGTVAGHPAHDSKESGRAMLPAVAETFDRLAKLRRRPLWSEQQPSVTKLSLLTGESHGHPVWD